MDKKDLAGELYDMSFTASMNQTYHQILWSRFAILDRSLKIGIGVMACISFGLSVGAGPWMTSVSAGISWASIIVSFVGLALAIALNVSPIDAYERQHQSLYQRWTLLLRDVQELELRLRGEPGDEEVAMVASELRRAVRVRHEIEADEPAAYPKLLQKCYEDENQRRWGVRTYAEVVEEKKKRELERERPMAQQPG